MKSLFSFLITSLIVVIAGLSSLSASAQTYTERWVIYDGFEHYMKIFGEGPPLLIINGGPGVSSDGFESLADSLSKEYTVVLYDQRGTGRSFARKSRQRDFTIAKMVEDIESIKAAMAVTEWTVMGHSFGGLLAYAYAAEYPNSVTALIQSSSGGMDLQVLDHLLINDRLTEVQRDSLSYYSNLAAEGDEEAQVKYNNILACAYVYNDSLAPAIAERLATADLEINEWIWNDLKKTHFDVKQEMLSFQSPVLILQGEFDMIDLSLSEKAHEILPDSKLVIVKDAGHYGWLDNPSQYLGTIRTFLKKVYPEEPKE